MRGDHQRKITGSGEELMPCFVRWTDEHGGVHDTEKFDNLMVALWVSQKDAARLGLEMKKVDGVEIRQIIDVAPVPR